MEFPARTTARVVVFAFLLFASAIAAAVSSPSVLASSDEPDLALLNPNTGLWQLRYGDGSTATFFYGNPGDTPLMGDWDCDGIDTVAMYRESSGFIYYRNSNDFGLADGELFFGLKGDIPIAGDWNNNGCDTFGIYRNGKVFLRNTLDTGVADIEYFFGLKGDRPFAGDFDGVGGSTVGLYRQTSGLVYFRNSLDTGVADFEFFYGNPSDRIVPGDWDMDGDDTVGIYRPSDHTFHLSLNNLQGPADLTVSFGQSSWLPTAGNFGPPPTPTLTFGNGIHVVGADIQPGTYRAATFSGSCYWERKSGFGGTIDEIIANSFTTIPQVVTIESSDAGFESDGCGTWTTDLSPITSGPLASFGDGVFIVGTDADMAAGTWRSSDFSGSCYWERKNGFGGTLDEIEANSFSSIRQIVTINSGDLGFESDGCGIWTRDLSPITSSPTAPVSDGIYLVGTDVAVGTWTSRGDFTGFCYWDRISGFSGELSDIIANDFTDTAPIVTISESDTGFTSDGCGTWDLQS